LKEKQEKLRIQIKKDLVSKPISGIVKSLNGKYNDLSELSNKIHIISITSTWCDVCEETFPTLSKISNKYTNTELIGISVWGDEDEENQLVKIINENDIGYKYYLDNTDVIPRKIDLFGFPTILIVDANNKLRYTVRGFNSEESLENIIDTVIDLIK
jgi:thiol-disulfide isomerase/thioredoxin